MNSITSSLFIFLSAYSLDASPCQHKQDQFNCVQYVKNYDADTITVNIPNTHPLLGSNISVRVRGVDAAEMRSSNFCERKASKKAKDLVSETLQDAKRIDLAQVDRDKYFRILANVIVDGKSLSEILLQNNLAVKYDGNKKPKVNWCRLLAEGQPTALD